MSRTIDADELEKQMTQYVNMLRVFRYLLVNSGYSVAEECLRMVQTAPTVDDVPVVHGRWMYEAHRENSNYRWNVTAVCSECCYEVKEVWAGFFPDIPDWIARDVALDSAKSVKLSNFCPNCGAKMDGKEE